LSSAFLYIAIVAIWAFVLIPRWLRRPHLLGGEETDQRNLRHERTAPGEAGEPGDEVRTDQEAPATTRDGSRATAPLAASRTRVLRSRRRLLVVLVTLMVLAATCDYLKLTSWWMCVPPAVMLGLYMLLLREAAVADAEKARLQAAEDRRDQPAQRTARTVQPASTAQVIDISARLGDQLYDQYEDATMRAVGD
jgi:hypothetical protein